MFWLERKVTMPAREEALPGRSDPMAVPERHYVSGRRLVPPFPAGMGRGMFGLGCFWGAERCFWQVPGVHVTATGYAGGHTPNPTYQEVCSGLTGHNEVVLVVFDPAVVSYASLLRIFWEAHDPTQGMRQGNDVGTQYRSGIYTYGEDKNDEALASRTAYQEALSARGLGPVTTEIVQAPTFFYAEEYHQQYLAKNPHGYCGHGGCGVPFPGREPRSTATA